MVLSNLGLVGWFCEVSVHLSFLMIIRLSHFYFSDNKLRFESAIGIFCCTYRCLGYVKRNRKGLRCSLTIVNSFEWILKNSIGGKDFSHRIRSRQWAPTFGENCFVLDRRTDNLFWVFALNYFRRYVEQKFLFQLDFVTAFFQND